MSSYQNRIDFIFRTRQILVQYEHKCNYEKTLFLNCCVGLLIMPQQCADHDKNISVDGLVDYENWGIDIKKIKTNRLGRGNDINSIENIAYHIRNSICHYRFDIINCNVENIENVHIRDKSGDDANAPITFDLELSFDEFRKFILKYAEMLELKLKNI